jgi:uncharacterized protein YceH (UPF0502 family)
MSTQLSAIEVRILGSLMEKALATPDYYPLSLNALTNACNQKSNRDPVVTYSENEVQFTLDGLEEKGCVNRSTVGRVPKYEESLSRKHDLVPCEIAALCILMLRGPQTAGEIRARSGRMCAFESLESVGETLEKLSEWGLAERLERLPGHKEPRFVHLLGERSVSPESVAEAGLPVDEALLGERVALLEAELAEMRADLETLKAAFLAFKAQFE